jgi:protein arginine kinase activator
MDHHDLPKDLPERSLECSECKKPIVVRYTEIVGESVIETSMCVDCPLLAKRLFGSQSSVTAPGMQINASGSICCGNCGTSWESVKTGSALGCSDCYGVFGDLILAELMTATKISSKINTSKKAMPIHIGRSPGESLEISPSLRLLALNEALKETLSREDYEQAAWLRDQIKALTDSDPKNGN